MNRLTIDFKVSPAGALQPPVRVTARNRCREDRAATSFFNANRAWLVATIGDIELKRRTAERAAENPCDGQVALSLRFLIASVLAHVDLRLPPVFAVCLRT
jgi:hypothetical protein